MYILSMKDTQVSTDASELMSLAIFDSSQL